MKKILLFLLFIPAFLFLSLSCGKGGASSAGDTSGSGEQAHNPGGGAEKNGQNGTQKPENAPAVPEVPVEEQDPVTKELSLEEILALPDDQIDLTKALLLISRQEGDPAGMDTEKYTAVINEMSAKLSEIITPSDTPQEIKDKMAEFIYSQQGFKASRDIDDLRTTMLTNVLRMKNGNCNGLSQLWLCLGQKLNLPLSAVNIPNHTFIRWDDAKGSRFNIETLDIFDQLSGEHKYGMSFGDDELIRMKFVKEKAIQSGAYMRPLSRKEFVSSVYSNIGAGQVAVSKMSRSGDEYRDLVQRGLQSLTRAAELDAKNFNAVYDRANVYAIYTKEYDKAIKDLDTAAALNTAPMIYALYGIAYAGLENYDTAKDFFKKALDDAEMSEGSRDFVLQKVAELYLKHGEIDEGLELCDAQIKQDYQKFFFYDMKAKLLSAKGMAEEALKESFFAVKYAGQNPNPYITRGRIYYGQGKIDQAKDDFAMAIKFKSFWDNEDMADAYYLFGKILLDEGRVKVARTNFLSALQYNPEHKGAKEGVEKTANDKK